MLQDILFALWFLLPAAVANMAPILTAAIPAFKHWNAPLDGGRTFRGVAIFGSHKTWRGLISGIVLATLTLYLQQVLVAHTNWTSFITGSLRYETLPTLILGPLFALGALGGDAVESFFKRQRGIKSGGTWVPFDQIDYIIGAIIASLPIFIATPSQYFWMLLIWFVMHLVFSYAGWLMKLKKQPI